MDRRRRLVAIAFNPRTRLRIGAGAVVGRGGQPRTGPPVIRPTDLVGSPARLGSGSFVS